MSKQIAVWFPTVRTGTGTDVFTERLVEGLKAKGIKAEITWLPLRAEYAPWSVPIPRPPSWASVVHVNTWLHPRFLPKKLPIVATLHHSIHHPDALSYKGRTRALYHKYWIAPIERRTMQRADKVIAVSQFVADTAQKTLLDIPIQVIYNGVDTSTFKPNEQARPKSVRFQLLYVGSWTLRKGVDLLPEIMRELGDGFELFYTGSPDTKDKASMPENMHNLGRLTGEKAVVSAMHNADGFLFPSRSEGLPLCAIEAMACGLPVIASRSSSLPEVVVDGVTGKLCNPNDVADFWEAVTSLSQKKPSKQKIADYIKENFSIKKNIEEHIEVYKYLH